MKLSKEEIFIKRIFGNFGYDLKKINEGEEKSPDFLLIDKGKKILIEMKTKNENEEILRTRNVILDKGHVYAKDTPLERKNNISKLVQKAAKQLASKKISFEADFCFVLLHTNGPASSYHMSQFESSIYGSTNLIAFNSKKNAVITCYYFYNSDFFNHKEIIDGAFLVSDQDLKLCINDLSPRYEALIQSGIFAAFHKGIIDPTEKENIGKVFSIRERIDRSKEHKLIHHLINKYSLMHVTVFNFNHHMLISRIEE